MLASYIVFHFLSGSLNVSGNRGLVVHLKLLRHMFVFSHLKFVNVSQLKYVFFLFSLDLLKKDEIRFLWYSWNFEDLYIC